MIGLTVNRRIADFNKDNLYEIPRIDTNYVKKN